MSGNEGIRRIYSLAKLIAGFGSLFGVLLWFSLLLFTHRGALGALVAWVALPTISGGFLAVVAWIVEGFMIGPGTRGNPLRISSCV
jgi:hypothetical protein